MYEPKTAVIAPRRDGEAGELPVKIAKLRFLGF
jgi:hypothetical protein